MATQKDFRIKNGLIVQNGNTAILDGSLQMGSGYTTVIDEDRSFYTNTITNAGTLTSGAITANSALGINRFQSNHTTSHDDWQVSPISIRERGLIGAGSTSNSYSPNLNFHWSTKVSRSLTMTSDGNFTLGEWTASGSPELSGNLSFLNTAGYRVNNTNVIDSSRNLTNIGTIDNSGAITSSNYISIKNAQFLYFGQSTSAIGSWTSRIYSNGSQQRFNAGSFSFSREGYATDEILNLTSGSVQIGANKTLQMNGTTVIDSSRNLTNIGTISSGAIASTGLTVTNTTPTLKLIESDQSKEYQVGSYGAAFAVLDASANAFRYVIDTSGNHSFNSGNATFAGDITTSGNLYVANQIIHSGDTNTWISFETDTISLRTGGNDRLTINNGGTTLGDNLAMGGNNIENAGTISSGAINSSDNITADGTNAYILANRSSTNRRSALVFTTNASNVNAQPPATSTIDYALGVTDSDEVSGNKFFIKAGDTNSSGSQFFLDSSGATFAGTISNDAIRASDLGSNSHNLSISGTSSPWSTTNRATIHLDGVSSSLIGFRHGNANKGYIYATGSVMEFLSYGSVALLANASGSVYGKLSASGIWNVSGSYALGGTTVIDSSRNLTNIGTISTSVAMSSSPSNIIYMAMSGTNIAGGGGAIRFDTSASNGETTKFYSSVEGIRSSSGGGSGQLAFFTTKSGVNGDAPTRKMTIDEYGNVGIATDSPASPLHVKVGTNQNLEVDSEGSELRLSAVNDARSANPAMRFQAESYKFYGASGVYRATIDSSGNLLVNQTATSDYTNTAGSSFRATGFSTHTRDGGDVLLLNRLTSDGNILLFRKNNSTVGSIGTNGGTLYISSPYGNDAGLRIGNGFVAPATNSGAANNNAIDLGYSGNAYKKLWVNQIAIGTTAVIDSSRNLTNIGTANVGSIQVTENSNAMMKSADNISEVGSGNFALQVTNTAQSALKPFGLRAEDIRFATQSGEQFRLDSSGNLLISKTSTSTSTVGVSISGTQGVRSTVSGNVALLLNRTTSFGDIALFRKDNSTVGSIGTVSSGDLYIADNRNAGIKLDGGNNQVVPVNSAGTQLDSTLDLGKSDTRFKDLYLSGTGYFGTNIAINAGNKILLSGAGDNTHHIYHDSSTDYDVVNYSTGFQLEHYSSGTQFTLVGSTGNATFGGTITTNGNGTSIFGGAITAQGNIQTDSGQMKSDKFTSVSFQNNSFLDLDDDNGVSSATNTTTLASIGNMNFIIDTNGNVGTDKFHWLKDNATPSSATRLMDLDKNANLVLVNGTVTGQSGGFFGGNLELYNSSDLIIGSGGEIKYGTTVVIDSSRNLTNIGTITSSGNITTTSGQIVATTSGDNPLQLNRTSSDGTIILLQQDGVNHGVIGGQEQQTNAPELYLANGLGSNSVGLAFWDYIQTARIAPCNGLGAYKDNYIDLGASSARFDDIYATNGTINTSDRNEKQDIQALTDAEQRVATACKGLIRRFRWQDSVAEKDDNSDSDETARYHFGVIAQDLQDAFTAEGLDASDYGMFISSTWEDDDGVEQTRLGVRYNELLAFIITTI